MKVSPFELLSSEENVQKTPPRKENSADVDMGDSDYLTFGDIMQVLVLINYCKLGWNYDG